MTDRLLNPLTSNIACTHANLEAVHWQRAMPELKTIGATFLTLWGTDNSDRDGSFSIHAAFLTPAGIEVLSHQVENTIHPTYPSIAQFFPAAARMERATHDLLGIVSTSPDRQPDQRGWLRHNAWPATTFPLRRGEGVISTGARSQKGVISTGAPSAEWRDPRISAATTPYPFVQVEGDGVHEIAVGPVHAGIIEPGHFRFSVVGEKVLRLEERLGYTHKGIAKLFESRTQQNGHQLAARVSGDSTVAFTWAYCAALESITATEIPARAASLRALALEHERLANHLGDLGALGNDAGFAFGLTQFSRLKEDLLRANAATFGSRYLFDYIFPGGVAADLPQASYAHLVHFYRDLEHEVTGMQSIYDEHGGLQDRFREAGLLDRHHAIQLGAIGLAARASGIAHDLRVDHPCPPYDKLATQIVTETGGDVAARVLVRFREIFESLRLCRVLLAGLSHTSVEAGPIATPIPTAEPNRLGIGLIEGWRGPVLIALETGPDDTIRRCHPHDPSWQNWPLLEYAILGNIVPDFPLINKSFNLSYSGQDG
jgi:Ni,Fe-hydrogenase III large subunit/Ni,Fe-hydrogenase III component G